MSTGAIMANHHEPLSVDRRFTSWQLFGIVGGSLVFLLILIGGLFVTIIQNSIHSASQDRKDHIELLRDTITKAQGSNDKAWMKLERNAEAQEGLAKEVRNLVKEIQERDLVFVTVAGKMSAAADAITKAAEVYKRRDEEERRP